MKVTFQSRFIVPGFGRKRFPSGEVVEVPESMRDMLPKTAEILPDDYVEPVIVQLEEDEMRAADGARANATELALKEAQAELEQARNGKDKELEEMRKQMAEMKILMQSGMGGFTEEKQTSVEPVVEPKPVEPVAKPVTKPADEDETVTRKPRVRVAPKDKDE